MNDRQPARTVFFSLWMRLLFFRASREDYNTLRRGHFWAGLLITWLVGIGRYWDDPRAEPLQILGAGSVIYIFVLAAILWIIFKPAAPKQFSYLHILTFIALTSPPAVIYAIPIEKWADLATANKLNLISLGIVATWRVGLLFHYLTVHGRLDGLRTFICGTMPLAVIFVALLSLNLHHVVFDIMGGIREADSSSQDAAYAILFSLSVLAIPLSGLSTLLWLLMLFSRPKESDTKRG